MVKIATDEKLSLLRPPMKELLGAEPITIIRIMNVRNNVKFKSKIFKMKNNSAVKYTDYNE